MLQSKTTSKVLHRTVLSWEWEPGHHRDRGEKFLASVLKLIRDERQIGRLTIDFGVGGGVSSVVFEETESIKQGEIEVAPQTPPKHYLQE